MDTTSSGGPAVKNGWRQSYVERQLSTARWAMDRGSIGAARAALRVLSGDDFEAGQEASWHLRVLRNHAAEKEDVVSAMRQLCALAPRATTTTLEMPIGGAACR